MEDYLQVELFSDLHVLKNVLHLCLRDRALYVQGRPLSQQHDFVTDRLRI